MTTSAADYMAAALQPAGVKRAHHFGLFMMKAVLDGRAAQLIDLAQENLLR